MRNRIVYASVKPTEETLTLFETAKFCDVEGLGNSEILERACHHLMNSYMSLDFSKYIKRTVYKSQSSLPSSFKVRVNNISLYQDVVDLLRRVYKVERVHTPFLFRIVLSIYIDSLQNSTITENVKSTDICDNIMSIDSFRDLSIDDKLVEIFKLLVERGA